MKELTWNETNHGYYIAETQHGRAIVEPASAPDSYNVRLELHSGEVVYHQDNIDLELAQELGQLFQPYFDKRQGRFDECGFVEETLKLCQPLISKERDANHWQRIEYIKEWIARYEGQSYNIEEIPVPTMPPIDFNWIEDGSRFYADTMYGQAVIVEKRSKNTIGGSSRHEAHIRHHTGAILDCSWWIDFMEAEYAIKQNLKVLERPGIYESNLSTIDFTLDICQRMLPEDADPIHFARLHTLATTLHLILE